MKKLLPVLFFISLRVFANIPHLEGVPLVSQSTNYSCGAAALLSVLKYFGIESYTEEELMKALGTNSVDGTNIDPMVKLANLHGLKAEKKIKATGEDLRASIQKMQPVIVGIQAWSHPPKAPTEYAKEWQDGHFAVLIGIDQENAFFMDPSLVGNRGILSINDLKLRWHDIDNKEKLEQPAVFFNATPNPPKNWVAIP